MQYIIKHKRGRKTIKNPNVLDMDKMQAIIDNATIMVERNCKVEIIFQYSGLTHKSNRQGGVCIHFHNRPNFHRIIVFVPTKQTKTKWQWHASDITICVGGYDYLEKRINRVGWVLGHELGHVYEPCTGETYNRLYKRRGMGYAGFEQRANEFAELVTQGII